MKVVNGDKDVYVGNLLTNLELDLNKLLLL